MSILYQNRVKRVAALLPAAATASIFTIGGGPVLVEAFFVLVVAATPATANALTVRNTPTSGTPLNLSTSVSVASLEAGSHVSLTDAAGGALIVGNAGTAPRPLHPGFVLNPGALQLTTTGTAVTGTWEWYLVYMPFVGAAFVVAA